MITNRFAHNIKILIAIEDITVKELAEKSNISYHTLSKITSNQLKPNLELIVTISKYFNVSIDDILTKKIRASFYDMQDI